MERPPTDDAQTFGYTKTIECGLMRLHIFDRSYLEPNISSDKPIPLTTIGFNHRATPYLTDSHLELLPEEEDYPRLIAGSINFDVPIQHARGSNTSATYLKQLNLYIRNIDIENNLNTVIKDHTLTIGDPVNPVATISLVAGNGIYSEMCFEIQAPLETRNSSLEIYEKINLISGIWGHLHNFIITTHLDTYSYATMKDPLDVYIGTTGDMQVSDIEIAIETRLGLLRKNNPDITLPGWSNDVSPKDLVILERQHIAHSVIDSAAHSLIREKRDIYGWMGNMVPISQGDIVSALAKSLSRRTGI